MPTQKKIKLFYVFSEADSSLARELDNHLALLKRQGLIESWHPGNIIAGGNIDQEISNRLDDADIILLLISADFLASASCYDVQMRRAIERHGEKTSLVIPILLRPVDYTGAPFSSLKTLPDDLMPIASYDSRDLAWSEVAKSIRIAVLARFIVKEYPAIASGRVLLRQKQILLGCLLVLAMLLIINSRFLSKQPMLQQRSSAPKKVALLIGNTNYRYVPNLKTPDRDAHDLADKLSRMGFNPILQINESKSATQAAIKQFIKKSDGAEMAIFMYFGHGVAVDGVNYLVPIDAEIHHDVDISKQSIDLNNFIEDIQQSSRFGTLLIVLDTCTKNISLSPRELSDDSSRQPESNKQAASLANPKRAAVTPKKKSGQLAASLAVKATDAGDATVAESRTHIVQTPHGDEPARDSEKSAKDPPFRWQEQDHENDSYFHNGKRADRGLDILLATFTPYIENSLIKILSNNVMIIYSSQPNENAIDYIPGIKNGPFAHALLSNIDTKGQPLANILSNVEKDVFEITRGKQRPWSRGTLTQDIYFTRDQ